ncbi:hypothetical protein PybrP1_005291 [[Pythium] brassicae (nom. inval.)]|nr:hypothetical protein PybrP1_005291 [[Pythium] brassicae (nom. inval.)]
MKGFFSNIKKKTRAESASAITEPQDATASSPTVVTFAYTGGDLFGITFQRAKSRFVDTAGPTRLEWHKEQRLGITFAERENGAVAVKSAEAAEVLEGQELIGVNGRPVVGVGFLAVMDALRTAKSPCQLDFTPPPSPILVAQVEQASGAHTNGVLPGMMLLAIDGVSMVGASLADVNRAVVRASEGRPVVLQLAPPARLLQRSGSASKSGLRNYAAFAAVAAVLAA